jgi:hypothetical protein
VENSVFNNSYLDCSKSNTADLSTNKSGTQKIKVSKCVWKIEIVIV